MYAKYGSYTHSPENLNACNLVSMDYSPVYSDRQKKYALMYRLRIQGDLIASTQADINTKIGALIDAYAENGKDWILYHDNGTETRHKLLQGNVNALSDVQVESRSWPSGAPEEYATGRVFHIVMRQLIADVESQILEYWETIRYTGHGGARYRPVWTASGLPIIQTVNEYTPIDMVQHGRVVAFQGWPDFYVPASAFPAYMTRWDIHYIKPRFSGKQYTHYGIEWTYVHTLPSFNQAYPGVPIF